jgi:hypothetical protein
VIDASDKMKKEQQLRQSVVKNEQDGMSASLLTASRAAQDP